jgi:4'-phosphopantetheinyl transferase
MNSPRLPPCFELGEDEIHVWQLAYRPAEGRGPLLGLLAKYLGMPAAAVVLVEGEHGRPALAAGHDPAFGFNWSHSGEHALVAVARHVAPGIDVERVQRRPRAMELARRYFSADEIALLAALPAALRDIAFIELWTAKEAVLKALGRGIAFGLHRLSIVNDMGRPSLARLEGHDIDAWQLHRLDLGESLRGALAWQGGERRIRLGTLADAG